MKLKPLAQFEFVGEAVRALRPRLCQTVAHLLPGQRTDQRIVERIQNPKWRYLRWGRRWVEPRRRDSDGPGHHRLSRQQRLGGNVLNRSNVGNRNTTRKRYELSPLHARPPPSRGAHDISFRCLWRGLLRCTQRPAREVFFGSRAAIRTLLLQSQSLSAVPHLPAMLVIC